MTKSTGSDYAGELRGQVEQALSGLTFRAGEGCYVAGTLAAVEFVARRRDDGGADLCFRIVPYALGENVQGAAARAAEAAFRQQLDHPDERVRALAARQLDRLRGPRVGADDLAGLLLELEVTLGGRERPLAQVTDARGTAVFEGVALASECRVLAARFGAPGPVPAPPTAAVRVQKS